MFASLALAALAFAPVGSTELLRQVDAEVDRQVTYQSDPAGQDYWQPATWAGDCEDYALLKRKRLIARGWPAEDLQVMFVEAKPGRFRGGHAVLVSHSKQAVLDNQDEKTHPEGRAIDLIPYLADGPYQLVCMVKDLSTGSKMASERC
jgi:predicted transglutaminase-like cysteine proteinase